jgi:hypothetical protein
MMAYHGLLLYDGLSFDYGLIWLDMTDIDRVDGRTAPAGLPFSRLLGAVSPPVSFSALLRSRFATCVTSAKHLNLIVVHVSARGRFAEMCHGGMPPSHISVSISVSVSVRGDHLYKLRYAIRSKSRILTYYKLRMYVV